MKTKKDDIEYNLTKSVAQGYGATPPLPLSKPKKKGKK